MTSTNDPLAILCKLEEGTSFRCVPMVIMLTTGFRIEVAVNISQLRFLAIIKHTILLNWEPLRRRVGLGNVS